MGPAIREDPEAAFNGQATIKDVTWPLNPVTVDGNATRQVTMSPAGAAEIACGVVRPTR